MIAKGTKVEFKAGRGWAGGVVEDYDGDVPGFPNGRYCVRGCGKRGEPGKLNYRDGSMVREVK